MIDWLRARFVGDRLTPSDDAELAFIEARVGASGGSGGASGDGGTGSDSDLADLGATVDALRSLGAVSAPRSFALTRESLAGAGYSERQAEEILAPARRSARLWQRPLVQQMPLVLSALAVLVGGVFLLDVGEDSVPMPGGAATESADSVAPMAVMDVGLDDQDDDADTGGGGAMGGTPEVARFDVEVESLAVEPMSAASEGAAEQQDAAPVPQSSEARGTVEEPDVGVQESDELAPRALRQTESGAESAALDEPAAVSGEVTTTLVDWLVPAAMFGVALLGLLAWFALRVWRRSWS